MPPDVAGRDVFTVAGYQDLVRALLARGYALRGFADADPAAAHLVLRHDIDQSIQAAREMAEAEAASGWSAIYFVLVRTEMYNPFAPAAARDLTQIRALGHRVGLHLDAGLYDCEPAALDAASATECAVLETILDAPVEDISFHRPAQALLGHEPRLAGRRHAYQPRYYSDMAYCSDSGGSWRHGHPLDHTAVTEGRALQLLTHPIWWTGPAAAPADRLQALLDARGAVLDQELDTHCASHRRRYPEETSA
ncbi:MAG: hypothetical protein QF926_15965 [Alphaproteobacteria bacterium]|jgi:hypothetical protein|nr:hypothetical protein [Alphaproteobacteria bacterium]MDP6518101.1 hypothetical protein [Alphaproteobacteria bacterium]